jgi:ribosomal-protein-alanine N-acetyltransferase
LVESVCAEAARLGVDRIFLEVRASNEAALRFYGGLGFQQIGRRRGYYPTPPPDPREDALLLAKSLQQAFPRSQVPTNNL